jgi:hypothetical protein
MMTLTQHPNNGADRTRTRALLPTIALALALALTMAPATASAQEESLIRGPDVTIIAQEEKTVFEYRQAGELRMIRVVPKWGKPYYLVPSDRSQNYGDLERAEMLLPSWVIVEF